MKVFYPIAIYVLAINIIAFAVYAADKFLARKYEFEKMFANDKSFGSRNKKKDHRIPERILLGLAFAGGSLGAMCAMEITRHKTGRKLPNGKVTKKIFFIGVPIIYAVQGALTYFFPLRKNFAYIACVVVYVLAGVFITLFHRSDHAKQNAANREAMQQSRNNGSYTPREPMNFNSDSKNNSDTWR